MGRCPGNTCGCASDIGCCPSFDLNSEVVNVGDCIGQSVDRSELSLIGGFDANGKFVDNLVLNSTGGFESSRQSDDRLPLALNAGCDEQLMYCRQSDDVVSLAEEFRKEICDGIVVPVVGMVFNTPEEAYKFYKDYSCRVGFGITRRSSHNFHGIKYDVTFSCNKNRPPSSDCRGEGFAVRNRGTSGTGCRAKIVVRDRSLAGKWVVEEAVVEHNHDLQPDNVRLMRCHSTIPLFVKKQLEINESAGLAQNKSFNTIFTQAGGVTRCMFTERDMRNYIAEYCRLKFCEGDAAALMKYFHQQQLDCPNFFYSCDIDDEGRLRNVFWADGRSRASFKYFGDVITFDTTYLTNRYRMPFAIFVGVNHHGQSILLGCALLANELIETYVWLFKTFLVCMSGRSPAAVITDQCAAICGAVEKVFPESRHRLCLWHIMKKFTKKLGGLSDRELIIEESSQIVYDSITEDEFERKWLAMMSSYDFGCSQKWFLGLYEMRARWVPVYVRSSFWAGMSTTQRSESMNAFFDGYVNSRTRLKCFVEKYSLALHAKWEKERYEDFRCSNRRVRLVSNFEFEKQFADVYTHRMFYVFQKEIKMLIGCSCSLGHCTDGVYTFHVKDNSFTDRMFNVQLRSESGEYQCDCKLFEFRGVVCRHGLCVYRQLGINVVPEKYVLSRWRCDFVRSHVMHNVGLPQAFRDSDRYDHLYRNVQQIVLELVEVGCRDARLGEKLLSGLAAFGHDLLSCSDVINPEVLPEEAVDRCEFGSDFVVKDPVVVSSKGRPRTKCFQRSFQKKGCKRGRRGKKGLDAGICSNGCAAIADPMGTSLIAGPTSVIAEVNNQIGASSLLESETQLQLAAMSACDLLRHFQSSQEVQL